MEDKKSIEELGLKIVDLIHEYSSKISSREIGHQLISNATSMMLYCAPNELDGVKTILACVECGIASYEENHS